MLRGLVIKAHFHSSMGRTARHLDSVTGIRLWPGTTQGPPDLIASGAVLLELKASGRLRDTHWVVLVPPNLFSFTETKLPSTRLPGMHPWLAPQHRSTAQHHNNAAPDSTTAPQHHSTAASHSPGMLRALGPPATSGLLQLMVDCGVERTPGETYLLWSWILEKSLPSYSTVSLGQNAQVDLKVAFAGHT